MRTCTAMSAGNSTGGRVSDPRRALHVCTSEGTLYTGSHRPIAMRCGASVLVRSPMDPAGDDVFHRRMPRRRMLSCCAAPLDRALGESGGLLCPCAKRWCVLCRRRGMHACRGGDGHRAQHVRRGTANPAVRSECSTSWSSRIANGRSILCAACRAEQSRARSAPAGRCRTFRTAPRRRTAAE